MSGYRYGPRPVVISVQGHLLLCTSDGHSGRFAHAAEWFDGCFAQQSRESFFVEAEQRRGVCVFACHDLHGPGAFSPGGSQERPCVEIGCAGDSREVSASVSFGEQSFEPWFCFVRTVGFGPHRHRRR